MLIHRRERIQPRINRHQPAAPRPRADRRIRHVARPRTRCLPALDHAPPVRAEHVPRVLAHGALGGVARVRGRGRGADVGFGGEALAAAEEEEDEDADEGEEGGDADAEAGGAAGREGFLVVVV